METLATNFFFMALLLAALGLTVGMVVSKNAMLGFPSAIFWAILGGYCYTQSTATWDIYYMLFFASFGMAIFCMLAMYALRTKKEEAQEGDLYFDEGGDKDIKFVDEGGSPSEYRALYDAYGNSRRPPRKADEEVVSSRVKGIQERAEARRKRGLA